MATLFVVAAALISLSAQGRCDSLADAARREDQLKAAYLFNFAKFVEWPASRPGEALTFCFVGGKGVQESLASGLSDKRIGTRKVALRSVDPSDASDGCDMLFLDARLPAPVRPAFCKRLQPMLTVSDARGFSREGGMITLFIEKNRLHFSVNVPHAQRVGLHLSSNLLQLASSVEKDGPS